MGALGQDGRVAKKVGELCISCMWPGSWHVNEAETGAAGEHPYEAGCE